MDVTNMSQIEDSSYDAFVAIAVLPHVKDDELVLSEVYRVLRPGGRCFFQAASTNKHPTKPFENLHEHYSREEYDLYKVGTFRIYNDLDLIKMFQEHFVVKTYHGIDPVCGGVDFIVCGHKLG